MAMSVYAKGVLNRRVKLSMLQLSECDSDTCISDILIRELEGRCITEGFVKPGSVTLLNKSVGKLQDEFVVFDVQCRAELALPFEKQVLTCVVVKNNHAGIVCNVQLYDPSPFEIYVFRNNHHAKSRFAKYEIDSEVVVEVDSFEFQVNDKFITITANLHDGIQESTDIDAPLYTTEIVDVISSQDILASPKKTFAIDSARASKEIRSMPNVIELDSKDFNTYENNTSIVDRFVLELHSTKAKTIVFAKDFGDAIYPKDPNTHRYLMDKLRIIGFHSTARDTSRAEDSASDAGSDY